MIPSRAVLVLAAAAGLASPVLAAAPPPAKAAAAAPTWTVDKAVSRLGFRVVYADAPLDGVFRAWDAQIAFDPGNLAGSRVAVTVDMASVSTDDTDAQDALPTGDWLNVRQAPRATFVANSFRDLGGGKYQAVGTLNLRGVSRPLTLPFTLAVNGAQARMTGSAVIDRNQFGVGQGQFKAGDTVGVNVTVNVQVVARRR
jgi:polyisoprenoid-binding protein YceI